MWEKCLALQNNIEMILIVNRQNVLFHVYIVMKTLNAWS